MNSPRGQPKGHYVIARHVVDHEQTDADPDQKAAYYRQIIMGQGGKNLADGAARAIEAAYQSMGRLGIVRGWFDADIAPESITSHYTTSEICETPTQEVRSAEISGRITASIHTLSELLMDANETVRFAVSGLLSRLAQHPEKSSEIAEAVSKVLGERGGSSSWPMRRVRTQTQNTGEMLPKLVKRQDKPKGGGI